jgi:type I restriction enzyme R subunit
MGWSPAATERAKEVVRSFASFLAENKDKLVALQIIYGRPYKTRHLTFEAIRQLADAIESPPYNLTPELLWKAYEQLDKSKVRGANPRKLLTDIISLVRFATDETETLEPFANGVEMRFVDWLAEQERLGRAFTAEQREWLAMIKGHIATSVRIEPEDFDNVPFEQKGGLVKASQLFGEGLDDLLDEMNKVLIS